MPFQGTKAEGAISKLFVGKMKSYIKCVNVDFESSRSEDFNGGEILRNILALLADHFKQTFN
jgi:ubiquitin carboxyl-terminal hydrolase 7